MAFNNRRKAVREEKSKVVVYNLVASNADTGPGTPQNHTVTLKGDPGPTNLTVTVTA
jgi:hypothetical protein